MLVFAEAGQSSAPLQQFTRPMAASPNAHIRAPRVGIPTEMQPYATIPPHFARLPKALMGLQANAGPGAAPMPAAQPEATTPTTAPNGMPSPVQVRAQRMLPPHIVQALGVIPFTGRGRPSGAFNPATLVRNPLRG